MRKYLVWSLAFPAVIIMNVVVLCINLGISATQVVVMFFSLPTKVLEYVESVLAETMD